MTTERTLYWYPRPSSAERCAWRSTRWSCRTPCIAWISAAVSSARRRFLALNPARQGARCWSMTASCWPEFERHHRLSRRTLRPVAQRPFRNAARGAALAVRRGPLSARSRQRRCGSTASFMPLQGPARATRGVAKRGEDRTWPDRSSCSRQRLATSAWLLGSDFTLLDCAFGPVLDAAPAWRLRLRTLPGRRRLSRTPCAPLPAWQRGEFWTGGLIWHAKRASVAAWRRGPSRHPPSPSCSQKLHRYCARMTAQ